MGSEHSRSHMNSADRSDDVGERRGTQRARIGRVAAGTAVTLVLAFTAVACGDDADDADSGAAAATVAPGATAADGASIGDPVIGEQLSRSMGCAGCHGQDFGGGAGPEWIGLAGSDVELEDGTIVVADTAYLIRAIADPSAELVAGYTLKMPANNLTDAEIADIVAYIETLDG
jgi:cytochrome c oxidase subunit 2